MKPIRGYSNGLLKTKKKKTREQEKEGEKIHVEYFFLLKVY